MIVVMYFGANDPYSLVMLATLVVLVVAWRKLQAYRASKIIIESSLLLSLHVPGAGLTKITEGTLQNIPYKLMIATGMNKTIETATDITTTRTNTSPVLINGALLPGATILMLTLPQKTNLHIASLGIPDADTHANVDNVAKDSGLENASLEGDFPDYFSLYCRPTQQTELREVLDPADMAFLVDYCKRENWEIFEDTVYFSQSSMPQADDDPHIDNTTMVKDAEDFIQRILPTLRRQTN